jgi:hypothetical protein
MERPKKKSKEVSRATMLQNPDAAVSQADAPASWVAIQAKLDQIAGSVAVPVRRRRGLDGVFPQDAALEAVPPPLPSTTPEPEAAPGPPPMPDGLADYFYTKEGQTAYWDIPEAFRPKPDTSAASSHPGPAYAAYIAGNTAATLAHAQKAAEVAEEHTARVVGNTPPPGAAEWVPLFLSWAGRYASRRAWCASLGVPYTSTYNWTRTGRMCLPSPRVVGMLVDRALAAQHTPGSADRLSAAELQVLLRLQVMPQQKKNPGLRTLPPKTAFRAGKASRLETYGEGTVAVPSLGGSGVDRRVPLPRPSTSKFMPAITPLILVECLRAVAVIILSHGSAYAAGMSLGMRSEILSAFVQGRSIPGRPTFMALTTWAYQQGAAGGPGTARYARYVQPLSVMARARRKRGEVEGAWKKALMLWAKVKVEEGL